jgi:hypothetical protein
MLLTIHFLKKIKSILDDRAPIRFTWFRVLIPKDLARMNPPNHLSLDGKQNAPDSLPELERMHALCLSFCGLYNLRLNLPQSQCLTACELPKPQYTEIHGNKNTSGALLEPQTFFGPFDFQKQRHLLPSTKSERPNS